MLISTNLIASSSLESDKLINERIVNRLDSGDVLFIEYWSNDSVFSYQLMKLNDHWKLYKELSRSVTLSFKKGDASMKVASKFKKSYNIKFGQEYNSDLFDSLYVPAGIKQTSLIEMALDSGTIYQNSISERVIGFINMINAKGAIPSGCGMYYGPYVNIHIQVNSKSKKIKIPERIEVPKRDFVAFLTYIEK
tara:strand:+ start:22766 stop:23344 length:579 start_codon:yes stop_codon:yes gene_type:complete